MKRTSCVFVFLLLVLVFALPAARSAPGEAKGLSPTVINKGDDGWATPGKGTTYIDLSKFPIEKVFNAKLTGGARVWLKGKPLDPKLGQIDTILHRPEDISLTGRKGSGPLELVALSLESEKPVLIGRSRYHLLLTLSDTARQSAPGRVTFAQTGGATGTFSVTFPITPKLVFTDEKGGQQVIDCGSVPCSRDGKPLELASKGNPWMVSGVRGGFDPEKAKVQKIEAGVRVGNYTTVGTSNFYPGVQASRLANVTESTAWGSHRVVLPHVELPHT